MSEKGVYMSHFFETPGLQKEAGGFEPSTDEKFKAEVLKPLESGTAHADGIAQYADDAFSCTNSPAAFIIRPDPFDGQGLVAGRYEDEIKGESDEYNQEVRDWNAYLDSLRKTVGNYNRAYDRRVKEMASLIKSKLGVDAKIVEYERSNEELSTSEQSSAGKVLFQYDPAHSDGSDCGTQAIARLWIANEEEIGHEMRW